LNQAIIQLFFIFFSKYPIIATRKNKYSYLKKKIVVTRNVGTMKT